MFVFFQINEYFAESKYWEVGKVLEGGIEGLGMWAGIEKRWKGVQISILMSMGEDGHLWF